MSSVAQITAALANAQHSTGPRTPEGKAVSSRNATKLGLFAESIIIPGEDPAAFDQLSQDWKDQYHPRTTLENQLVERVVVAVWMKRRYLRLEAEVTNSYFATLEPGATLGDIYLADAKGPKLLDKIFRRQQAANREFNRALADLRAACPPSPQPVTVPVTASPVNAEPPNPVRSSKTGYPAWPGGPTPLRTPKDNWDNPALRL